MLALAAFGAICQIVAHVLAWKEERLPRYTIGSAIIGVAFSLGWLLDPRQHPVIGLWLVMGCSGAAVWACYAWRGQSAPPTENDPIARFVESEFGGNEKH